LMSRGIVHGCRPTSFNGTRRGTRLWPSSCDPEPPSAVRAILGIGGLGAGVRRLGLPGLQRIGVGRVRFPALCSRAGLIGLLCPGNVVRGP